MRRTNPVDENMTSALGVDISRPMAGLVRELLGRTLEHEAIGVAFMRTGNGPAATLIYADRSANLWLCLSGDYEYFESTTKEAFEAGDMAELAHRLLITFREKATALQRAVRLSGEH